jgi:hypothetical protein
MIMQNEKFKVKNSRRQLACTAGCFALLTVLSESDMKRKDATRHSRNQFLLACGGKRSATPLWKLGPQSKGGVAATLCHCSPKSSRFLKVLTNSKDAKAQGVFITLRLRAFAPLR